MTISKSGLIPKSKVYSVEISVPAEHPLIKLMLTLPWEELYTAIETDLIKTPKGKCFTGRPLQIRTHLGAYALQHVYNLTDRKTEYMLKDNAAAQIFCGVHDVEKWRSIDHTKIETFRSRLTPETQVKMNNLILLKATSLGFADPSKMDVDSTVQEANMAYPSDVNMLKKLFIKCGKIRSYIAKHIPYPSETAEQLKTRVKEVSSLVKEYLFTKKDKESAEYKKKEVLKSIVEKVSSDVYGLLTMPIHEEDVRKLPWNIKESLMQIRNKAKIFIAGVHFFIETNTRLEEKPMSFHLNEVACFNKGKKYGKPIQFGRAFQLGRIGGNFLLCGSSTDVRMEDKRSVKTMIDLHQKLFGDGVLESFGADKGYFSNANKKYLSTMKDLKEICLQKPALDISALEDIQKEVYTRLADRRSGVEPLIGHVKHGGQLGKSRMKKDSTSLAAGYAAVLGFNLRQMIRHIQGKKILAMT